MSGKAVRARRRARRLRDRTERAAERRHHFREEVDHVKLDVMWEAGLQESP